MSLSSQPAQDRLAAIEALDELIITLDRDLRITFVNATVVKLLATQAAGLIGSPLLQIVAPPQRLDLTHLLDRARRGEVVSRQPTALLRADGEEVPVAMAIGPIGGPDAPSGLVLLGSDIVEQQKLHFRLLHSKRMESTGQLAGAMAHDFNNILTAIIALADFTARALPHDSAERADLEELREQALKGSKLVKHLLAFSRRPLQRMEIVNIGTIFNELEPLLQRLVSERILITTDATRDTRPVEIDRAQMELVILELVSNASDAMGEGGSLSIEIVPLSMTDHPTLRPGDYVRISVRDNGLGFTAGATPKLMDPFFTTKGGGHFGLGLTMVESVITQHGGTVTVESAPGQGTAVHILLPGAGARPAVGPLVEASASAGGNETVLVVEDEIAVRAIVCRSLRDRGYTVLEAKNGEDALIVAEKHNAPIHLVVTDVVMPEMGGADLYRHLRRWYPTMRILFISGYAKGAIPEEALAEGGGAGFLAKPFTLEQLAVEVRRIIELPRGSAATIKA